MNHWIMKAEREEYIALDEYMTKLQLRMRGFSAEAVAALSYKEARYVLDGFKEREHLRFMNQFKAIWQQVDEAYQQVAAKEALGKRSRPQMD